MRTLFTEMARRFEAGRDMVLVSVLASSGSTPRGAGARMLVDGDGRVCGTIGGGAVELRATQQAAEALANRQSLTRQYILRRNEVEDLGMICGGDVEVFIQFIPADDAPLRTVVEAALDALGRDSDVWLITAPGEGRMGLYTAESGVTGLPLRREEAESLLTAKGRKGEIGGAAYSAELIQAAGRVYIFGGGHIGQELAPTLGRVGFRCVVFDDREDFTRPELFPGAEAVVRGDFARIGDTVQVGKADYAVVVTRGHACDFQATDQMLHAGPCYLGVIGSKRKMAAVKARLIEAGHSEAAVQGIYTPIGLEIGAETPAEIAVSIAAEMIRVRAERLGRI